MRNPHAGEPFDTSDEDIAAALQDVSIPTLMLSLVHMTGDPAWVRGALRPKYASPVDFQGGMSEADCAEARARALPAIAAFRDAGCVAHPLSHDVLAEVMDFVAALPAEPLASLPTSLLYKS